jgi:hypothetical protein
MTKDAVHLRPKDGASWHLFVKLKKGSKSVKVAPVIVAGEGKDHGPT